MDIMDIYRFYAYYSVFLLAIYLPFTGQLMDIVILWRNRKVVRNMRKSYLNLIGRDLDDINREFQVLLVKIQAGLPKTANEEDSEIIKKAFNKDVDGWINWLESIKYK